jgi:hypothetical protein
MSPGMREAGAEEFEKRRRLINYTIAVREKA